MNLAGKRVFVIEDEAFIAAMVEDLLIEMGAVVIGPVPTVKRGLVVAAEEVIDVALLDVNIGSVRVDPVAEVLRTRGIPIVFATGYGKAPTAGINSEFVLEKPYARETLGHALSRAITSRTQGR